MFWVIVYGIADSAFKGLEMVEKLLSTKPPKGRELLTLKWTQNDPLWSFQSLYSAHLVPHTKLLIDDALLITASAAGIYYVRTRLINVIRLFLSPLYP